MVTKDDDFDVLYAWGWNYYGQLGLGTGDKTNRTYPTLVPGLPPNSNITHVANSDYVTTIVVNGDQIWTTGRNLYDEHGDPDLGDRQTFALNTKWPGGAVKSIYAGKAHRVVITDDKVWVWGDNQYGQLGTTDYTDRKVPVDITDKIVAVNRDWASGKFYLNDCNTAILVDGQLHMWGSDSGGRLGNGIISGDVATPPTDPLYFASNIKKYSMGGDHSLALLENGDLYSWGWNNIGQLGIDSTENSLIPAKVTSMLGDTPISGVTDVFTVGSTSYIQIGNKIYSCGSNRMGLLAQGPTLINTKIFSPVILDSSAVINSIYTTYSNLIVNLNTGLYMAGSNQYGQFANGLIAAYSNNTLTQVTPFGYIEIKTKSDNTKYKADDVVADLKKQTTAANIRSSLAKYVDGIDSIPLESTLSYQAPPVANADKTEVTLTLKTNRSFGENDAKIEGDFDFPITITNLGREESSIIIKNKPTGVHTGNIQTKLNPNPGSVPSPLWASEIVDMTKFPDGTTFTSITNDEITVGTGTDGTYTGNIFASNYYATSGATGTSKSFPFVIDGLTKVADSKFAADQPIHDDLNFGNYAAELQIGQAIKPEYLDMFVEKGTFPDDTIFTIVSRHGDEDNKTLSCDISYDKHYKDGLLKTSGTKSFTFNNFKTIENSVIFFTGYGDTGIHSGNISEKLINADKTVNIDILKQLVSLQKFPTEDTKFTIKGEPTLNISDKFYSVNMVADLAYENWVQVPNKEFTIKFTEITIVEDSKTTSSAILPDLNIENIGTELPDGQPINDKYLPMFVDSTTFPDDTIFTIDNSKVDTTNKTFSCDVLYNKYYEGGFLKTNGTKNFTFNDFRTIRESGIDFKSFEGTDINSANIDEKLITDGTVNKDVLRQIAELKGFAADTIFTIKGKPTLNINTRTYKGIMIASQAYVNWVQVPNKEFAFEFTGITVVADSKTTSTTIHPDLNIDNIKIELPNGQQINDKYLSMFVDERTFPTGTIFRIDRVIVYEENKTFSCDVLYDKYYKDGLLKTNGKQSLIFNDFKTIEISEINFKSFEGSGIHSGNISEKLINADQTVKTDVLRQIAELKGFFTETIFTIKGTPTLDANAGTYSGTITASKSYKDWSVVTSSEDFVFTFDGLQKIEDSKVVNKNLPSGYHINNIETQLTTHGTKIIRKEILYKFIDTDKFPTNATFTMGVAKKDEPNNKFTFDIIPSHHYIDGVAIANTAQKIYQVTIQFKELPPAPIPTPIFAPEESNLGLIIGLSVGGAALIGIIAFGIWWKLKH